MNDLLSLCFGLRNTYIYSNLNTNAYHEFQRYFVWNNTRWRQQQLAILLGPRGVGKTVALLQIVWEALGYDPEKTNALYVPIDHFKLKTHSLYDIGETFANYGGELLCIDEIHNYSNWSQELKSLHETFPNLRILASGSSILEIEKEAYDLSRRAHVEHVFGMSFREYLEFKYSSLNTKLFLGDITSILKHHQDASTSIVELLKAEKINVLTEFRQYLIEGYYPYFRQIQGTDVFLGSLERQVRMTIEMDIPSLYNTFTHTSTKKITRLLHFLAQSAPYSPNFTKLGEALEITDTRTLKNYLKILEDATLIQPLYKYKDGFKHVEEQEKIYLQNPNLQYALSSVPNTSDFTGTIRETFLMSMLKPSKIDVRSPQKGDFILQHKGKNYTLEVGGKNKSFDQIKDMQNSFVISDDILISEGNRIPLWLFGFLY